MKSFSFRLFVTMLTLASVSMALLQLPACSTNAAVDSKEWAKGNHCPYEGAECPNAQKYLQDYQIQIYLDTVWVYDADRLVGTIVDPKGQYGMALENIILNDNL